MSEQEQTLQGGQLLSAVSAEMVGIFRDFLGKGPERCKSYWAGSDMLVILLGGGFTVAEQTLFEAGRGSAVQDSRFALQQTLAKADDEHDRGAHGPRGHRLHVCLAPGAGSVGRDFRARASGGGHAGRRVPA